VAAFGRLDVVVNNAEHADFGSVEDMPAEVFARQVDTVFGGVFTLTRAALPVLRGQRRGRIIQVSSMGARMGSPGLAAYQAAKAAVTVFSMSLAKEVAHLGITVTVVEPGNLRTDITSAASMQMLDYGQDYQAALDAMRRYLEDNDGHQTGDPAKAAAAIIELAGMDSPPVRVPLGSDALGFAAAAADDLAAGDRATATLSRSIDFN
ncbi:MAG: SDR family NAD(P)-dependent oxidoreductase, partial [Mycobacterium sp.]